MRIALPGFSYTACRALACNLQSFMIKILITGATGGLGQMAVDYALKKEAKVSAIGRNGHVLERLAAKGASTYLADLLSLPDEFLLRQLHGQDAVWHCAGLVAPWGHRDDFLEANVRLATRMFAAAARVGVPVFVHVSSPSLYFDFKSRYDVPESFQPARYASLYAQTKAQGERELLALAKDNPHTRLVILRPRALYGLYDKVVLPRIARMVKERNGRLVLPQGGNVTLDLCDQENAAHALWLATHSAVPSGEIFNITDNSPVLVKDLVADIAEHLGLALKVTSLPYPVMHVGAVLAERLADWRGTEPAVTTHGLGSIAFDMTLSICNAQALLGFEPVISTQEGLARALKALKA